MLRIDDRLGSYAIAAGEAWIMSVQMKTMVGNAIIDWSTRRLVQSFYGPGRTLVDQIEGVYSSDASGAYFAFIRDGRFSESLLGQTVQVELAERLLEGRAIIATGPLTVASSSDGVTSFGSIIGRVDCRFTLYFTTSGLLSLVEQDLLPYAGVPITPGPAITTPAGISSDGTPQVGETLTGIDPVGNGPIVARRWIAGGTTVTTMQTYAPTATGTLHYEADLQGPDGNVATSGSTITVSPATPITTPAAFTMTQLATPNRIYQRTAKTGGSGAGTGPIPVTLNVTQAGTIYARTRSTTGSNPVLQAAWKAIDNAPVATGPVPVPGVNARVEDFFLDLSPDGTTWTNGTVPVGMGKLIAYGGQSLMEAMLVRRTAGETMASVGETPTTAGRVLSQAGPWQALADSDAEGSVNSAGFNALIRLQAAKEGCRIGMVGYAQGATEIAQWVPGGDCWAKFIASINASGNLIESAIWMQGHTDSANNNLLSVYYRKQLSAMYAALDTAVTDKTFTRYIATIPNISTASWGKEYKKEAVRCAGERWCRENPRAVSVIMDDLSLNDGTHQDQRGAVETAVNFHRHIVNPATAIGATIGPVSVNGAVLSVPLTLPTGATALAITGDLKSRLGVWPRSLRNPTDALAIQDVAIGTVSNGIVPLKITLDPAPGPYGLDVYFNPKNDPANDGSAIVLRNDLAGDGATYGRQVTSARPAQYAVARDLTLNNGPAYSAGRWAGRQGLSAGAGSGGLYALGTWAEGYTVEAWIKHTGAAGTNVFLMVAGAYLAFDGDDFNYNGGVRAGLLPRNVWHHVAFTVDAGIALLHIDGITIIGSGGPGDNFPSATELGVRGFGNGGFRPNPDTCTISDVAIWGQCRYGNDDFTVPTGPYAGTEPFLDHLWTLNGNALDSRVR